MKNSPSVVLPYLTFNGNCREAMTFYQKCLGGELFLQTINDSPLTESMSGKMKNCILHASLTQSTFSILGSDMVPDSGLIRGNAVSLSLECSNEDEISERFNSLSEGGIIRHPIEQTFYGSLLGGLTDKFGNHWLLHFNKNN